MARKYHGLVAGLSRTLDQLAGYCLVAVMLVVVGNVLMRALFKQPSLRPNVSLNCWMRRKRFPTKRRPKT